MPAAGLSDCAEPQVRGAEGLRAEGLGADHAAKAVLQATTEASEADQAGLSCRARQTWWITLIVGPLSLRSGASGARPGYRPAWPARPLGEGGRDGPGRYAASVMPRAYSGASGWAAGRSPGEASLARCPGGAAPDRGGCPLRYPRGGAAPDGVRAVSDSRSDARTVNDTVSECAIDSE